MFASNPLNEEELENTQIIANIFGYLSWEELQNARLLNFAFNKIVTTHPDLFWAKNVFRVSIRPCENERQLKREWAQLRLHPLVTAYNCPNFHFLKTDILAPGAVDLFFQSTVRYQIKYLKLTNCHVTCEILIHILACIGAKLEHLEISDFSRFENAPTSEASFPKAGSMPYFPSLVTLIISGTPPCVELPRGFVHTLLHGSCNLENICLHEWNAKTCKRFIKCLGSVCPSKLDNIQSLEISCTTEKHLRRKEQYGFLNEFEWIYVPNLRRLQMSFDKGVNCETDQSAVENDAVETMTNSVAIMVEGAINSLETIELVNCPVSNNVFRSGISSFRNLCHVNTRGSFVTKLDDDANPVYCYSIINRNRRRRRDNKRGGSTKTNGETEITNVITTASGRLCRFGNLTRIEAYSIACAMFVFVAITHLVANWALGSYLGQNVEIVIFAFTIFWITKRCEISDMWSKAFPDPD